MKVEPQRLKKFIIDAGLINENQFTKALEKSKESKREIDEILISSGLIKEKELIKIKAYLLGIPFINLENEIISPDILKIIPESIARAHNIIAFNKKNNNLEVAMLDPEDLRTIEFIKKTTPSFKILSRLTTSESIKNALSQYQKTLEIEFESLIKGNGETEGVKHIKDEEIFKENDDVKKAAEEMPIIMIVDTLLKHAILQGASDVHIEPSEKNIAVRYRIDGILRDAMILPIIAALGIVARIKVLSNLKLDEHRLPQDGRFKIETEDFKYSIRVSILPVFNGEKVVMRLLAENTKSSTLDGLGFTGKALEQIRDSLAKPSGMILITGPTGCGKTTTLYAIMEILNTPDVNISTVEDPIEYRMPRINQTQINSKIGLTFASGLRVLVRQDPDIIMVGEIRDDETAGLAINAALTGHLVLSTLHTTEAAGSIPRLIDMKAEPFLISSTLNLIIAQRLVRKFSGSKEKYKLKPSDLKSLAKYCNLERILEILKKEKLIKPKATVKDIEFYRPKPSKDSPDGYKGRIGIVEVLPVSEIIKELIVKKATTKEIADQAIKEGMRTMIEDGFVKAAQGITSIEEVLRVITE
ncbi:MAG: ATPase, T2SS/T4P/T4SS family [Patescibacteria group bacterium]